MRLTKKELRSIIREEISNIKESPMGRYHTPAHKFNMAVQHIKKALGVLSGVPGAEEAVQALSDAEAAVRAAWK